MDDRTKEPLGKCKYLELSKRVKLKVYGYAFFARKESRNEAFNRGVI